MLAKITKIVFVVIILTLLLTVYLFVSDKFFTKSKGKDTSQPIPKSELIINELVGRHNAIKDWSNDVYYTIQLQEKIVGKPVLYKGSIDDIFLKEGKTFIKLNSSYLDEVNYVLELECDNQLIEKIRNRSVDRDSIDAINDYYAIVAQVENMSKIGSDDAEFTGIGKCIDLEYVEENN